MRLPLSFITPFSMAKCRKPMRSRLTSITVPSAPYSVRSSVYRFGSSALHGLMFAITASVVIVSFTGSCSDCHAMVPSVPYSVATALEAASALLMDATKASVASPVVASKSGSIFQSRTCAAGMAVSSTLRYSPCRRQKSWSSSHAALLNSKHATARVLWPS